MSLFYTYKERVVPYTKTVHEHRAPTDESVRILREMEAAAREQVLCTHVIDNYVHGVVSLTRDDIDAGLIAHVRFSVNGKAYAVNENIGDIELVAFGKREARDILRKHVASAVARVLCANE